MFAGFWVLIFHRITSMSGFEIKFALRNKETARRCHRLGAPGEELAEQLLTRNDIQKSQQPFDHGRYVKALNRLPELPWD
jgi:hypothetical protein